MADTIVLTGPTGSSINVASFLLADPGADFGETGLLKAGYSENPAQEGGQLAYEYVNLRAMEFPLRVASIGAFGGAAGVQSWLRTLARPGATLDVLLDGVATAEADRFDVVDGRFELARWNTHLWTQADRLEGARILDVQPFGYWPTMILLASAASVGGPGVLNLNLGGSIFGDVPGLAEIFIAPTSATSYGSSQKTDSVYWSLGARPSFQAWWTAASGLNVGSSTKYVPTLLGDQFAPGSQAIRYHLASDASNTLIFYGAGWKNMVSWVVPPSLEPAYRGRFRAFAWLRLGSWQNPALTFYASLDTAGGTSAIQALGSAAQIATIPVAAASQVIGVGGASPAYSFVDLGEFSAPAYGSYNSELQLRLWMRSATINVGYAGTGLLDIGGLYLLPMDVAAGILARGILQPTALNSGDVPNVLTRAYFSGITPDFLLATPTSVVGSIGPVKDALSYYHGQVPKVGASTIQLDLNLAGQQTTDPYPTSPPPIRSEPHFAQVSVRYRPRFAFMKGL